MTEADSIWEEIKDLPIEIAALPNQTVEEHVTRLSGAPDKLFLKLRASYVIASLEALVAEEVTVQWEKDAKGEKHKVSSPKYAMEESEGYIILSRVGKNPQLNKHKGEVYIAGKNTPKIDTRIPQAPPEVKKDVKAVVASGEKVIPEGMEGQTRGGEATD